MHTITKRKLTRNWECKVKYIIKDTLKKAPRILGTILSCLGVVLTIAECVHWMFHTEIIYEWMHTYVFFYFIVMYCDRFCN